MGLVEIVNPNGQKGLVADTSDAARVYDRPPSARDTETDGTDPSGVPGNPAPQAQPPERPNRNASRDDWLTYAIAHGANPDDLTDLTRDQLADTYGQEA